MNNMNITFKSLENLIGERHLSQRSRVHITIVGVGGIGSWCAEYLARSAIGQITLIDLDDICISNTNRQLHTLQSTIGKSKVLTLKDRLLDINPNLTIHAIEDFLTINNLSTYITSNTIVLDAIDSLSVKCELIDYCLKNKIKLVTTGGAGGKLNPNQIKVSDLSQTYNDPLLLRIRKKLRRSHDFPKAKKIFLGIPTIFSPEIGIKPEEQLTIENEVFCDQSLVAPNCNNGLGTCVTVISTFAAYAAKEVLNLIDNYES